MAAALRDAEIRDAATGRMVRAAELVDDDRFFDVQAGTLLQNDPTMLDAVIEFEGMHAGFDTDRLLPRIECPVLLLLADERRGSAASAEDADRAVERLRDGRITRVPGTTHGLVWEEPEAVLRALEDFLGSL